MLKSTHTKAVLPEGWSEHRAPSGHSYFYHATTKQSTYIRPVVPPALPTPPTNLIESSLQHQSVETIPNSISGTNIFPQHDDSFGVRDGLSRVKGGGGYDKPRGSRPQPIDKPKSRYTIPGHDPWILVHTKLGRRFVYNSEKDQSFWRIPDKLKDAILALDQQRIKEKAEALVKEDKPSESVEILGASEQPTEGEAAPTAGHDREDSSEYEEVEVTDDEDEEGIPWKRQRTDELLPSEPVEFNEEDIAFQLASMGQEYGLDPGEYGDEGIDGWKEAADVAEMPYEDSIALFKDLLNDYKINPYSPWEKLIEEGKLVDDVRYTALTSMKARKEAWEEWTREKIQALKEQRTKEEKEDPRIPYLSFLHKNASPKLYWPEFKRKYKREAEMRDSSIADRDREKYYREHINRLKLPQSTLKSDLSTLLKSQPLSLLNNSSSSDHLPPAVLADIRFISLDPATRDPLVNGYITTLPPPPLDDTQIETKEVTKEKVDRERRLKALADREIHVADEKRRQRHNLDLGKGRLQEEEAEIARAMNISKKGLRDHLMDVDEVSNAD